MLGSVIHCSVVEPKNLDTHESDSQAELVLLVQGSCFENRCCNAECKREQWPERPPGVQSGSSQKAHPISTSPFPIANRERPGNCFQSIPPRTSLSLLSLLPAISDWDSAPQRELKIVTMWGGRNKVPVLMSPPWNGSRCVFL